MKRSGYLRNGFLCLLLALSIAGIYAIPAMTQPAPGPVRGADVPKADVLLTRTAAGIPHVRAFNATANTAAARGVALRAAVAASTSGDALEMGPGIFNIDGTQAKLEVPVGVQLSGQGIDVTTIQSAWTSAQIADDATLSVNSGVKLRDFTFHNTNSSGYALSIGRVSDATLVVGCVLQRIKIYAPNSPDCFYHWQDANGSSYYLYDCQMYSGWDCIAMPDSDAGDTLYAENCYFESTGTNWSGPPNGTQGCIVSVNTAMEFKGCRFKVRADASGNTSTYGIAFINSAIKLTDCHFDVSAADGAVIADLARTAGGTGTCETSGGSGSGTNGAYTTSNLTPTRKADGLASRTITATAPLTVGGGSSATLGADRTVAFSNQNANTVLAGPTSGAAAAPAFRASVPADIPFMFVGGVPLSGAKPVCLHFSGLVTGANTFSTYGTSGAVPTGKRLILLSWTMINPDGGTTSNCSMRVIIGGVTYRLAANSAVSALTSPIHVTGGTVSGLGYVCEAGETPVFYTDRDNGNLWVKCIEFDDTNTLKSLKKASAAWVTTAAGNVIATMAANHYFMPLDSGVGALGDASRVLWTNESLNTAIVSLHVGKATTTPDAGNQISNISSGLTIADAARGNLSAQFSLAPTDSLIAVTDQAGQQLLWVTGFELTIP